MRRRPLSLGKCTRRPISGSSIEMPELAEAAAEAAESVRATQAKRWSSPSAQRTWTPRCEIYLYPDGKMLAQATGQPDTSPGFSAMEVNGNRIVARKVHLRADHTQMRDRHLTPRGNPRCHGRPVHSRATTAMGR